MKKSLGFAAAFIVTTSAWAGDALMILQPINHGVDDAVKHEQRIEQQVNDLAKRLGLKPNEISLGEPLRDNRNAGRVFNFTRELTDAERAAFKQVGMIAVRPEGAQWRLFPMVSPLKSGLFMIETGCEKLSRERCIALLNERVAELSRKFGISIKPYRAIMTPQPSQIFELSGDLTKYQVKQLQEFGTVSKAVSVGGAFRFTRIVPAAVLGVAAAASLQQAAHAHDVQNRTSQSRTNASVPNLDDADSVLDQVH